MYALAHTTVCAVVVRSWLYCTVLVTVRLLHRQWLGTVACYYELSSEPYMTLVRFYRATHFSAKLGIQIARRPSVCLSVRV